MAEKFKIMLVDDEPQILEALTDLLEEEFNVVSDTSPVDALARIKNGERVSVIVSDQIMPQLSGDKFLAETRKHTDANRILFTGYADISAVAAAVNEGKIYGYLTKPWTPADVISTVRKAAEHCELNRTVRRERMMFNNLMRSVSDGVFFKDCEGRYLSVNEVEASILKQEDAAGVIGATLSDLLPAEQAKCWSEAETLVLEQGEPISNESREMVGKDGSKQIWSVNLAPVHNSDGEVEGLIGVSRDVTEERHLQQMKDEFVSTVSHELRTPLTAILGSLGLLRGGILGKLPEEAAQLIEVCHSNCGRLLRLVNDILDLEKLNRGALSVAYNAVNIESLLKEAVDANTGLAQQKHQSIERSVCSASLHVRGDSDRLMQVLANLISNALKFSPDGGKIRLRATKTDSHVRIAVTDMGGGVPEDFRKRIFQRFSQADGSDVRLKGGAGLGLNISRSIVELHGGVINYRTHKNMGTTFYFDLPLISDPTRECINTEMPIDQNHRDENVPALKLA